MRSFAYRPASLGVVSGGERGTPGRDTAGYNLSLRVGGDALPGSFHVSGGTRAGLHGGHRGGCVRGPAGGQAFRRERDCRVRRVEHSPVKMLFGVSRSLNLPRRYHAFLVNRAAAQARCARGLLRRSGTSPSGQSPPSSARGEIPRLDR